MHPVVNIALRAALGAAETIAHATDRLDRVRILERRGSELVTSMDKDAEAALLYHLRKSYPDYSVQSRLSGYTEGRDTHNTWLIDPLDGNAGFLRGLPDFCVSLALKSGNRVSHAVVVNPLLNEAYTATRGSGAQLNKLRLRVSRQDSLQHAVVALDAHCDTETLLALQRELRSAEAGLRMTGCLALDVVAVAAGRMDAGWCCGRNSTRLAAALLILQESGALISDESGNPDVGGAGELVFGNPRCFKHLLKLRQSVRQG